MLVYEVSTMSKNDTEGGNCISFWMYYNGIKRSFMVIVFFVLLLLSLGGSIFFIVRPDILSLALNRTVARKYVVIGSVVYFLIFLPVMLLATFSANSPLSSSGSIPPTASVSPVAMDTSGQTSSAASGPQGADLGITRDTLIAQMKQSDPTIVFQLDTPIENQQTYTAYSGADVIHVIGVADHLTKITSTEDFGDNPSDILDTVLRVVGFARVLDSDMDSWVTSVIQDINNQVPNDNGNGGNILVQKEFFLHNRHYVVSVKDSIVSLTITPSKKRQ